MVQVVRELSVVDVTVLDVIRANLILAIVMKLTHEIILIVVILIAGLVDSS